MILKRQVIEDAHGFDEEIGTGARTPWQSGEGTDLLLRVLDRRPLLVRWLPQVTVTGVRQAHGLTESEARRKLRAYGRGFGYVAARHALPWRFHLVHLAALSVKSVLRPRREGSRMRWRRASAGPGLSPAFVRGGENDRARAELDDGLRADLAGQPLLPVARRVLQRRTRMGLRSLVGVSHFPAACPTQGHARDRALHRAHAVRHDGVGGAADDRRTLRPVAVAQPGQVGHPGGLAGHHPRPYRCRGPRGSPDHRRRSPWSVRTTPCFARRLRRQRGRSSLL